MTTPAEAMGVVAEEGGPSAASLLAAIMDQQARDREGMLPTWELLWADQKKYREWGFEEGYRAATADMMDRLFGAEEGNK